MRFLILSGNTGGGHNSAANAIKEHFEQNGHTCVVADALRFLSEGTSYLISNGHVFIYRKAPKLFGFMYHFAEKHPAKNNSESFMYDILSLGARSLKNFLSENGFDGIICTHIFAGMIVTEAKRRYDITAKLYLIATDFTCSPGAAEVIADIYFIPHRFLAAEFEERRIPKDKIIASGIPVSAKFFEKTEKKEAKRQLGLPADKRIILMMCGSMGCGPIEDLTVLLSHEIPSDCHLVVICGGNEKLLKKIKKQKHENVSVVGFTDKIPLYMDASELALTKPGGLSTSEALTKALPLILIDAVPGCETRNLDFLTLNNFSQTAKNTERLSILTCRYLKNPMLLEETKQRLRQQFGFNAAETVRLCVEEDLKR